MVKNLGNGNVDALIVFPPQYIAGQRPLSLQATSINSRIQPVQLLGTTYCGEESFIHGR